MRYRGIHASSDHGPEIYGAIYVLGSLAKNRNLNVGGEELPSTTVRNGAGGGFKSRCASLRSQAISSEFRRSCLDWAMR